MKKIESTSAKGSWGTNTTRGNLHAPSNLDINCGNCARSQVGVALPWQKMGGKSLFAEFRCVGCDSPNRLFMLNSPQAVPKSGDDLKKTEFYQHPSKVTAKFDEEIEKLSPRYVAVYSQAEQLGLDEIVGCGYRRALEVLVKDFLVNHKYRDSSEEREKVRNPSLRLDKAIEKLEDPGIIESARAASWLGNDKTHYTEKHNATVEELKGFIAIVVAHMKFQLLIEKMKKK